MLALSEQCNYTCELSENVNWLPLFHSIIRNVVPSIKYLSNIFQESHLIEATPNLSTTSISDLDIGNQ